MELNTTKDAAIICAENIALLELLHSQPTLPSSNLIDEQLSRREGYQLSFETERALTGTLAFLSSIKDDPDHIPAVCIEERPNNGHLNVLLAVNKSTKSDGAYILQELKEGFEGVFKVLSRVRDDSISNVQEQVFTAIIFSCSRRIISRIRLTQSRRQSLKLLQSATSYFRQGVDKKSEKFIPIIKSFLEKAQDVVKLADSWLKHLVLTRLGEFVQGIYRLWTVEQLRPLLLDNIPNHIMDIDLRKSLLNILGKVSRYWEAARYLFRLAKRSTLARGLQIVLVQLPQRAYQTQAPVNTPELQSAVSRIAVSREQQNLGHICRLLKTKEQYASNKFSQQTIKTLRDGKIHAEMQLVFYCESKTSQRPPRVICSSKDACFLCNAFIVMLGKMHIPRQHGRLYPHWRLPLMPQLNRLEQQFNRVLADYARNSIGTLLKRQKKTEHPCPIESTLGTLSISTSTSKSLSDAFVEVENKSGFFGPADHVAAIRSSSQTSSKASTATLKPPPTYHAEASRVRPEDEGLEILPLRSTVETPSKASKTRTKSASTNYTEANIVRPQDDVKISTLENTTPESPSKASTNPSNSIPTSRPEAIATKLCNTRPGSQFSTSSIPSSTSSTDGVDIRLLQGHERSKHIKHGCRSRFHTAPGLELQFEYLTSPNLEIPENLLTVLSG